MKQAVTLGKLFVPFCISDSFASDVITLRSGYTQNLSMFSELSLFILCALNKKAEDFFVKFITYISKRETPDSRSDHY